MAKHDVGDESPLAEVLGSGLGEGIGQIAGGVWDIFNSQDLISQGRADQTMAKMDLRRLRATQPSLDTPSAYYEMVKNAYDKSIMNARLNDINRSMATTAKAVGQYGSRGLGTLLQTDFRADQQRRDVSLRQQDLQTNVLRSLASAQERSIGYKEQRSARDIAYAYDEKKVGQAFEQQGQNMLTQGVGNIAGGIGSTVLGLYTGGILG